MLKTKCLILICGPPACLKSTLINILRCLFNESIPSCNLKSICLNKFDEILARNTKCHFLVFDDLLRDYEKEIFENEFNWKAYRSLIADELERMICNSPSERNPSDLKLSSVILDRLCQSFRPSHRRPSIVFIEDNFYYSSMRHRYRQIAQRAHLGFLVIHLHSKLSTALQRNARRELTQRVSNHSIENIYSKYEFDDDDLRIDTDDRGLTSEHLQTIVQRIECACQQPEELLNVIDEEQRRRDRQINEENVIYQIDQRLRKFISNYLKEQFQIEEKYSDSKEKKIFAEKINQKRQEFLEFIRRKSLQFEQIERTFQEFVEKSSS